MAMKSHALLLIFPLLTSCAISFGPIGDNKSESSDVSSSSSLVSSSSSSSSSSASSSSPSSQSSSSIVSGPRTLEVYAINDFHGAIKEEGSFPGIKTLGSYFADKGDDENTILISSGDMFQGSLESNYNSGHLLADVMNECEFDAFSLGNHDFDWGLEALKSNKDRVSSSGYQTPYLCANLYDYSSSSGEGNAQQSDYGGEYAIKVQENGLRVGIIGAIGRQQLTSITSTYMQDVCFKDPAPIIKNISDKLRTEENCDVVILSFHAGQSSMLGQGITSTSSVSGKPYVDLVLCAHTHKFESTTENGIIFTQNDDKGENASHVTLTVSESGEVSGELETVTVSDMKAEVQQNGYDQAISDLVASYGQETDAVGSQVLGNLSGSFYSSEQLPNLVAQAMLEEASESFSDIDLAMVNNGRATLYSGSLTYSSLFSAIPFDNEIYILEVSGSVLIKEASYNYIARGREEAFESTATSTYRVAVIDYLAVHQDLSRVYDYFPGFTLVGKVAADGGGKRVYRDIAADYIKSKGTVRSSDYASSLNRHNHNRDTLTTAVTL